MFISPYGLIHILLRDDYYGLAALAASLWTLLAKADSYISREEVMTAPIVRARG